MIVDIFSADGRLRSVLHWFKEAIAEPGNPEPLKLKRHIVCSPPGTEFIVGGLSFMDQEQIEGSKRNDEMTDEEKRDRVIQLAFEGDRERFEEFCAVIRAELPEGTGAVLRGSSVTGVRYADGAPFDADGEGTSDLDLTLVGANVISLFNLDGFYVPMIHSRPLSDKDPDIAPSLIPLRERLQRMVHRPVNIQATRDFVMFLRGDIIGQPYLTLIEKTEESESEATEL